jgi:hypothetical protein
MELPEHRDLVYRIAQNRAPVSDILGGCNAKLLMFWCLYFLKDEVYYIDDLDLIVLAKHADMTLEVYDIVGKTVSPFAELYPYLASEKDTHAEFLFMTDKLQLEKPESIRLSGENGTNVTEDFPLLHEKFIFPVTLQA